MKIRLSERQIELISGRRRVSTVLYFARSQDQPSWVGVPRVLSAVGEKAEFTVQSLQNVRKRSDISDGKFTLEDPWTLLILTGILMGY
jgi:hypothetical protein